MVVHRSYVGCRGSVAKMGLRAAFKSPALPAAALTSKQDGIGGSWRERAESVCNLSDPITARLEQRFILSIRPICRSSLSRFAGGTSFEESVVHVHGSIISL